MPASERSKELEREIWEALEEILSERGKYDPLVDTTFWTDADHRAYRTAFAKVKEAIEKKAGGDPDAGERAHKRRMGIA